MRSGLPRVFAALLLIVLVLPDALLPCAPAPRPGQYVKIAEESAIVIWDETSKTQHFIRRASFDTAAEDFGFLVPTPSVPELAEVDNYVFDNLEYRIRPETVVRTRTSGIDLTPLVLYPFFLLGAGDGAPETAGVRVLSTQRVAGYDAAVLKADNANDLKEWLGKNGYASSPALAEWLKPYVAGRWAVTAFKIAKDEKRPVVATSAVRMSFATERPFFPYREPADQRTPVESNAGDRLLRIFFLSTSRFDAALGDMAPGSWPGRTIWSDAMNDYDRATLGKLLPGGNRQLTPGTWLTVFEDNSSPRPGTDEVYFAAAAQQQSVHLPPIVKTVDRPIPVPFDVLLLLAVFIIGIVFLIRRNRRKEALM